MKGEALLKEGVAMKKLAVAMAVLLFFVYSFAGADTAVYDNDKNLMYRIRGNQVFDTNGNKVGYLRGAKIYDLDKNPLYRIKGLRLYDESGNAVGRKRVVPPYSPQQKRKY
jgi:hypothetical protein